MKFIINHNNKTIHQRETLDERCNVDDIVRREQVGFKEAANFALFEDYHICEWCLEEFEGQGSQ